MWYKYFYYFLLLILFVFSPLALVAGEKPDWVKRSQKGKSLINASNYYYGIGISSQSSEIADNQARKEFAKNIEFQVKCVEKEIIKEKNGHLWESFVSISEVVSDINFRGVTISQRYYDKKLEKYYSIIKIQKDRYNKLVYEELQNRLEREKYKNRIEEASKREEIRSEQENFKLWLEQENNYLEMKLTKIKLRKEKEAKRKRYIEIFKNTYGDFLEIQPPSKLISFYNGELSSMKNQLSLSLNICKYPFRSIFYAHKFWNLELSTYCEFDKKSFSRQDLSIKYQLLPNSGSFYKTSLSMGLTAYEYNISKKKFAQIKPEASLFLSGNITIPDIRFSYISFYGGFRKISIGLTSLLFYEQLADKICTILELSYLNDKNLRNKHNDAFIIQPGLRFKTAKNMYSTISYRDYNLFSLNIIWEF